MSSILGRTKRQKEQGRLQHRQEKEARRAQRKVEKDAKPDKADGGLDPDIAHIKPGPQPIPEE
ncbi:MAG: hypothetical protein ACJ790_19785 [Myxococcaceae bacterium]